MNMLSPRGPARLGHTMACTLVAAVSIATASAAHAQDAAYNPTGWRPFVGVGFTTGGTTLLRVNVIEQGTSSAFREDISAGGGFELRLGASRRLGELPFSLQLSAGLHNDQQAGVDGTKYKFRRVPLEALLQWHATPRARLGFGVRKANHALFKVTNGRGRDANGNTVSGINFSVSLKPSLAWVLEAEYALTPGWSVKGRYVDEHFTVRAPDGERIEAKHMGLQSVWYVD
jgi:hypothetical protein